MAKATKTRHSLILALLFLTLLASLGMLAMVVMTSRNQPSNEEIVATCARQSAMSAATASQAITNACSGDKAQALKAVIATNSYPGFSYPADWSAFSQDNLSNQVISNATYLNPSIIHFCDGCDGPVLSITMSTQEIDLATLDSGGPATSFDDFATNHYYKDPNYTNMVMNKTSLGAGTLYTYKGHEDGMFNGDFETLVYAGKETWVRVTYLDLDDSETATNDAWTIVKGSLDFSQIP